MTQSKSSAQAPFRVALIGFGVGGAVFHAPLVAAVPELELAAIVTANPTRAAQASREYSSARILASADEVFAGAKDFDLVIVCSPNRHHFEQAKAALDAGLHVVVDKPMTVESAQARHLIELARAKNRLLSVFQNRRLDGDFLTVQKIVKEKMLGKLARYESRFDRYRPVPRANAWREKGSKEDGGGLLFDLGSHLIDQACHLFGDPLEVYCELDRRREGVSTDDDCFVSLLFSEGVRASLHASVLCRLKAPRFRLSGHLGAFEKYGLDPQEDSLRAGLRPGQPGWGVDKPEDWGRLLTEVNGLVVDGRVETTVGAYEVFYHDIARALADHAAGKAAVPAVIPEDALRTACVIEAAYQSSVEKRIITIEPSWLEPKK